MAEKVPDDIPASAQALNQLIDFFQNRPAPTPPGRAEQLFSDTAYHVGRAAGWTYGWAVHFGRNVRIGFQESKDA